MVGEGAIDGMERARELSLLAAAAAARGRRETAKGVEAHTHSTKKKRRLTHSFISLSLRLLGFTSILHRSSTSAVDLCVLLVPRLLF